MTVVPGALAVDVGARTITGLAVPYGRQAVNGGRRLRFLPGWARHDGRVRLLVDHDPAQRAGKALHIADTAAGLAVVLFVNRGRRGDRLLAETESGRLGLSVGAPPQWCEFQPDPDDPGLRLVVSGRLTEISLTAKPAFGFEVMT